MNESAPYKLQYEVYPEDGMYIARCLNLDIVTDGATDEEAVENLREAIELYLERNAEALISGAQEDDSPDDETD